MPDMVMQTNRGKFKVVVADDNSILLAALSRYIDHMPDLECVGCIGNGSDVVEAVTRLHPDVLVIDLSLPGGDTVNIIRQLQSITPQTRAIVYSGHEDDGGTLNAGASQFVRKSSDINELLDIIREVAATSQVAAA